MSSSEKFCLKWNDFQHNIATAFHGLREESDFSDVTLVCEEDQKVEAHRIVLSACSPFFRALLKRNHHSHPMIYMRGLKSKDLLAIVDFIYYGETNVYENDLDGFLALAEELQLKGLVNDQPSPVPEQKLCDPKIEKGIIKKQKVHKLNNPDTKRDYINLDIDAMNSFNSSEDHKESIIAMIPAQSDSCITKMDTSMEDLKVKVASMMERGTDGNNKWICTVCGKGARDRTDMGRHIESHIEGLSFPCQHCA